ncbi:MAG: M1 family aminopeptidase, partial [Bryobacteraceae bacterium]
GLTVFLAAPLTRGATSIAISAAGDAILRPGSADIQGAGYWGTNKFEDVFYPLSTTSWYPTHGFLQRSTFDLVFLHRDSHRVISIGDPYEVKGASDKGEKTTGWKMDVPVALASFAVGRFERTEREGKAPTPTVEYNAPTSFGISKENYMLTELSNDAGFFTELFGPCPFNHISAVVHPREFGQGFPSMIFLAPTIQFGNTREFSFFAHEMAHQWWGHVVGWKSYRDQWMSEGFAQYSAVIYVKARQNRDAEIDLIHRMRKSLLAPPYSETGVGKGRVVDLGPIILGLRAATPQTLNAYDSLVYTKGALVLRMIDFLLSQPVDGDDKAFFAMMKDFAARYSGRAASTEDFFALASEHFRRSPIAKKYGLQNLDWFYQQWVTQAVLPSYRMEYAVVAQGNGFLLNGTVHQENAPADWIMPLPLAIHFGKAQEAHGTIEAKGESNAFSIPLPMKPSSVVLDPDSFVLSEKTESVNTGK